MESTPVSIKLSAPGGVAVTWNDGHQSLYPHAHLRRNCPCASCEGRPLNIVEDGPGSLPIVGQNPVRAVGANQVGHYAIQFIFNDGHQTGIYEFGYLRGICPCPECQGGTG